MSARWSIPFAWKAPRSIRADRWGLARTHILRGLLAGLTLTGTGYASPLSSPIENRTIPLFIGIQRVTAEVAQTPEARARGLMGRTALAEDTGMLFVFGEAARHCLWMKDTLHPLSAAFLRRDGSVVNLVEMQPGTLDYHCAESEAFYALEMPGGWFSRHGIRPGQVVQDLPGRLESAYQ